MINFFRKELVTPESMVEISKIYKKKQDKRHAKWVENEYDTSIKYVNKKIKESAFLGKFDVEVHIAVEVSDRIESRFRNLGFNVRSSIAGIDYNKFDIKWNVE